MTRKFIKGLDLGEIFYREAVKPLLDEHYPNLTYSAALLGAGSEILGFDTAQSADHDWGPRLMLFLQPEDHDEIGRELFQFFRTHLPKEVRGYSTNFAKPDGGSSFMAPTDGDEINHRIGIYTVGGLFKHMLRFDPRDEMQPADWVKVPGYNLRMATAGRVYHDGLNQLDLIRKKLAYYPHDVWLYLLATQWSRIGEEEAFVGRTGQVGDELGSRLVAGRLINDMMRLCFLMERQYPTYIKWYGTAFSKLNCADELIPIFMAVMDAQRWHAREKALIQAYEIVMRKHNSLGLTDEIEPTVRLFHDRPFLVTQAERFAAALYNKVEDTAVLALPRYLGSIDQFVDSTAALQYLDRFESLYV
ncbi:MAG: DUF4037 domain-containing protein [Chloroflexota bacterium]